MVVLAAGLGGGAPVGWLVGPAGHASLVTSGRLARFWLDGQYSFLTWAKGCHTFTLTGGFSDVAHGLVVVSYRFSSNGCHNVHGHSSCINQ